MPEILSHVLDARLPYRLHRDGVFQNMGVRQVFGDSRSGCVSLHELPETQSADGEERFQRLGVFENFADASVMLERIGSGIPPHR